jgi:hypothetical protein
VRSARLYETGVGYFERAGRLAAGEDTISLPAAKVDDALKTLVVLSDGAPVRVSAVEFPSVLSEALARVQAGLPTQLGQHLSYPVLLASLRGLEVEVTLGTGEKLSGRLADVTEVEPRPKTEADEQMAGGREAEDGGSEAEQSSAATPASARSARLRAPELSRYAITVLGEEGVTRLDSARIRAVRPRDPALAARLDSAVSTASEHGAQAPRQLRVSTVGDAPVRIGYVTETPVWRATYRLLLGEAPAATLQGWVLIHNDGDEPWQRVAIEIVNGRPDSFLYPLTAPRYLRRPMATPESEMSTLPQLASKTVDQLWGDHDDSLSSVTDVETFGAGGLGAVGEGAGGGGQGFGSGHGSLTAGHVARGASSELSVGNLAQIVQSQALASGAEFRYRMVDPLTLGAHSSALVPFTQVALSSELMTRFAWGDEEGRVAAKISNSSAQTLPAGPVAVYMRAGLAGESALPRLVSGQVAWLSYGSDQDVRFERDSVLREVNTTKLVRFDARRGLVEHYVRHREQPLRIENRSALPRTVCIELPVIDNAKVQGAERLLYDRDAQRSLGIFGLKARATLTPTLAFDEGLEQSTALAGLTRERLQELAAVKELEAPARAVLVEAATFLARQPDPKQREQNRQKLSQLETERERLEHTIEKLKDVGGNGAEPLVRRLVELEARRNRLQAESEALTDAGARGLPELGAILERLNPPGPDAKTSR